MPVFCSTCVKSLIDHSYIKPVRCYCDIAMETDAQRQQGKLWMHGLETKKEQREDVSNVFILLILYCLPQ